MKANGIVWPLTSYERLQRYWQQNGREKLTPGQRRRTDKKSRSYLRWVYGE